MIDKQQKQIDGLEKDNVKLKKSLILLQQAVNKLQQMIKKQNEQNRRIVNDMQVLTRSVSEMQSLLRRNH